MAYHIAFVNCYHGYMTVTELLQKMRFSCVPKPNLFCDFFAFIALRFQIGKFFVLVIVKEHF